MDPYPRIRPRSRDSTPGRARSPPTDGRFPPPRAGGAPGKVVDHVAISYEQASAALAGRSTPPAFPRVIRPLIRWLLLSKVLKTGRFPKNAKAPPGFAPPATPLARDARLARLRASASTFERDAGSFRADAVARPVCREIQNAPMEK